MRKFIFNTSVLSAVFGAWSIIQTTRTGPRDWRLILMWLSWGATVAIAIGSAKKEADELRIEE
ncbi:hypothetical protein [Homoserinimonas sp. OAct 916]|uniref:hypothetical protein n=1 Tax=Homoserinimonas sp. OAct 916 TaxID=2211450 RepID=UPI000DBE277F|nr:hypothetical protein [Homoserinimonas sp. OAct 916]